MTTTIAGPATVASASARPASATGDPFRLGVEASLNRLLVLLGSPYSDAAAPDRVARSRARLALAGEVVRQGGVPYRHQAARAEITTAAAVWDAMFALPAVEFTPVASAADNGTNLIPAWTLPCGLVVDLVFSSRGASPLSTDVRDRAAALLDTCAATAVRVLPLTAPRLAHVLTADGRTVEHQSWLWQLLLETSPSQGELVDADGALAVAS